MKKFENKILFYIVLIGALNWGALAIFKLNLTPASACRLAIQDCK